MPWINRVCLGHGKEILNRLCLGRAHKSERLEVLVADPQNSHRDTMDRRAALVLVLASSRIVLCACVLLCVSFSELNSPFQMV